VNHGPNKKGLNTSKVESLLQGFVDTHVHAGHTHTAREFDIWQLIREAEAGGFAAVVLKDDMKN
jgi:dihydroorotase-like cyclic amidohydrolase